MSPYCTFAYGIIINQASVGSELVCDSLVVSQEFASSVTTGEQSAGVARGHNQKGPVTPALAASVPSLQRPKIPTPLIRTFKKQVTRTIYTIVNPSSPAIFPVRISFNERDSPRKMHLMACNFSWKVNLS